MRLTSRGAPDAPGHDRRGRRRRRRPRRPRRRRPRWRSGRRRRRRGGAPHDAGERHGRRRGRHGAKSMTRRTGRGPALLDTPRRSAAQCGDPNPRPPVGRQAPVPRSRLAIPFETTGAAHDRASDRLPRSASNRSTKHYGDVVAVDGIDLEVRDGEFFSMLGPSGSGKTTTLRMIAGFELPTAGRILLHGADVTAVPPFDRDVNTVFQDYALFPHMTVGDNVAYGLVVRKVAKAERVARVTEALRMVRLEGYEKRKPSQLSGGQRQRVALARALVNRPARAAPRRAARGARPQAPRGDADRAQGDPAAGRDHVHLRDPRPGGGAHDERPPGRLQPGPDRADRRPGRGLRAPGDAVRGRLRGHVEPADGRGRGAGHRLGRDVHDPAREDPPRRAGCAGRPGRDVGDRCRSAASSISAPTRAISFGSTPAPSSSSPSRTCRRPRPRRSPRKARLSASCGSGSINSPSRWGERGGGQRDEDARSDGARGIGGDRRRGMLEQRSEHGPSSTAAPVRRRPRLPARRRARRPARASRPSSGAPRARRSTSWPGRATSRTDRPTRRSTG